MRRLLKSERCILVYLLVGFILLFIMFFITTSCLIGRGVKKLCIEAKKNYGSDCVEALIIQLNDEHQNLKTRNRAIWALGQLGDSRALPVLKSYYLTMGGLNITAWIWR